ncbi:MULTISPECIES: MerR family transcriptional regulator [unclassified Saccharothrix]|uniref:MerR family transcriptional regulator n=1 Tax=unclassified Saccharothrix TaxID=2593673 RepID=UPI00307DAD38
MNGDTSLTIGELARRTGLTVKAVRFYADRGIVPPTHRTPTGQRRFDPTAASRLALVRTLRALDVDLATVRRVLDRETTVAEVAAAHADALDAHLRVLALRRAVLGWLCSNPEETDVVHDLALLSADARRLLVEDFLTAVFAGRPGTEGPARTLTPELPDDPQPAQVAAWVELAELTRDPDFRALLARLVARQGHLRPDGPVRPDAVALVRDRARLDLDPESAEAGAVVAEIGEVEIDYVEAANDPRRERYMTLLALINGWDAPESAAAELAWFLEAHRHHAR